MFKFQKMENWAQIRNRKAFEMFLTDSNDFGIIQELVTWNIALF